MAIRNGLNLKRELENKNEEYMNTDAFLGKDLLTFPNKMSSSRNMMFNSHLDQFVVLAQPEFPRVFTNYENQVGSYSSSYKKMDREWTIVKRINKFKFAPNTSYILVVKDENDNYDIIERKEGERLTEHYCYTNDNSVIDSKKDGDILQEGEVLYHSTSFDEDMNFRYGINARAVYLIENNTIEDAIVISESLAKRLDSFYIEEIDISINTNDILCNLYGDTDTYKSFPDIGEYTKGEILTTRRRINYDTALFDLKSEHLRRVISNLDSIFYADGKVVDIEIFNNQDINDLKINAFNTQIVKYIEAQQMYNLQLVEVLRPIVENPNNKCSSNLTYLYRRAKDIVNPDIRWVDKSDFDGMIIRFTVLKRNHIHVGTKISGRFGNKGVVSQIRPDAQMPMNEYGEHAEIIFNALGVCNRLNPAQLYELEINFLAENVQRKLKTLRTQKEKLALILEFIRDIHEEEYIALFKYLKTLSKEDKVKFIKETEEEGFYLHQPPFWNNIGFDRLAEIYDKYDWIKPYKCTIDGEEIRTPLIMGREYILKLKHEPLGKFSSRSSAYINMRGVPSKSLSFKSNQSLYSNTPIRMGEMEIDNLLLTQTDDVVKLLSLYSSSELNRQYMIEQLLLGDCLNAETIELAEKHDNHNRRILDVYLKSL